MFKMDFAFGGGASARDQCNNEAEKPSLRSSFSQGSSRLFGSVIAKKNGLFDGISNRFDQVMTKVGGPSNSMAPEPDPSRARPRPVNTCQPAAGPVGQGSKINGGITVGCTQTGPRSAPPPPTAISFDEPLYGRVDSGFHGTHPQQSQLSGPRETSHASMASSTNPFSPNFIPDNQHKATVAEVHITNASDTSMKKVVSPPTSIRSNPFGDFPAPGASLPGSLGADLLPGIPRVPSAKEGMLCVSAPGKDLLAITPTTSEALPMPGIEPEKPDDCDSGSSTETEGCDDIPGDYGGVDMDDTGNYMPHSWSMGSDKSWSSNLSSDSQQDELSRDCMEFMKLFVGHIFNSGASIQQAEKARFGELCQHGPGRLWFARYVSTQRVNNKKVDEQIFYRLVQYFAVALFECNEAEDFVPAKTLMNMCFTFFHQNYNVRHTEIVQQSSGPTYKHFLYSYLKDQAIWRSLRFWNAAFFDAVQCERARKPMVTSIDGSEARMDDREFQENITFGQLGTFTCNMRAFGLPKDLCLEFLRKQCTIANLREEQVQMLKENVERWSD